MKKFVFGVISFNHASYIVEHLESIKFLIEHYGAGTEFKLVLGDDGSRDQTVDLVQAWLAKNQSLFVEVILLADKKNRGTCLNYANLCEHIDSPYFKITASDDVYSYVNLFEIMRKNPGFDYISGMPLLLMNGEIVESKSTILHTFATKHIFSRLPFGDRLKQISVMNTPNLLYSHRFIKNPKVIDFIRQFSVTEDYPMMVRISEEYGDVDFKQLDEVLVYYRRTSGSTFLIKSTDFNKDKLGVFTHLINNEKCWIKKLLLKNRLWCYKIKNPIFQKAFNLNYYQYVLRFLAKAPGIFSDYIRLKVDKKRHHLHYKMIAQEAASFHSSMRSEMKT